MSKPNKTSFSAKILAISRNSKMFCMFMLGYSSGLPLMLTASSLLLWYKDFNIEIKDISLLTLVAIPYTIKYLWAPILDKVTIRGLGRRKGWILICQAALIVLIALMSQFSPASSPLIIAVIAFGICFVSATQDIAINAYQTEVLTEHERALGNSIAVMGYRVGMLITGSIVLILADKFTHGYKLADATINAQMGIDILNHGWSNAWLCILIFFTIPLIYTFFIKESEHINPLKTFTEAFTQPFIEFFTRKGFSVALIIIAMLIAYKLADAIAFSLNSVFFVDLGFSKTTIAVSYKALSMIFTILGLLVGGLIAKRVGIYRSFLYFSIAMAFANLTYVALALVGKNYYLMVCSVSVEYFCGAMSTAILVAMITSLVNVRFSATQFAILSSIDSIGRVIVGPLAGSVQSACNWEGLFIFSFIIGLVVSAFIILFKKQIKEMANLV